MPMKTGVELANPMPSASADSAMSTDALRKEIRESESRIRETQRTVRAQEKELNALIRRFKEAWYVHYKEQKGNEAHEWKKRCEEGLAALKSASRAYLAQERFGLASARLMLALKDVEGASVVLKGILGAEIMEQKQIDSRALLAALGESAWRQNAETVSELRRTRLEGAVLSFGKALRAFGQSSDAFIAVLDEMLDKSPEGAALKEKREALSRVRDTVTENGKAFLSLSDGRLTLFSLVSALKAAKRVDARILEALQDRGLIGECIDADALTEALRDAEKRAKSAQPTGAAPFA